MTTGELYDLIGLPAPVRVKYESWEREGCSRMTAGLESRLLCREKWDQAVEELKNLLGEDPGHLRLLWEELCIAVRQWPKWERIGIPLEIYRDTMAFATRYLKDGLAAYGEYCFTAGWWFPRQLAMELFRLGSLEFELTRTGEGPVVYFHIPTDASLAPEAVDDSIRRLRDFAGRFYPEWQDAAMVCDSWLMSPAIRPLLSPDSKIRAFQDRFVLFSVDADNMGALGWVFPGYKDVSADLPENTSLQRTLKAFLLSGGKPGWAAGKLK